MSAGQILIVPQRTSRDNTGSHNGLWIAGVIGGSIVWSFGKNEAISEPLSAEDVPVTTYAFGDFKGASPLLDGNTPASSFQTNAVNDPGDLASQEQGSEQMASLSEEAAIFDATNIDDQPIRAPFSTVSGIRSTDVDPTSAPPSSVQNAAGSTLPGFMSTVQTFDLTLDDDLLTNPDDVVPDIGAIISGSEGDDVIEGTELADSISAGDGDDVVFAGAGNDEVFGGSGDDFLAGEDGDDVLSGDAGDDELLGGAGDDLLFGGSGNDALSGGEGDDFLAGGLGDDDLTGGAGQDTLLGEAGNDSFVVNSLHDLALETLGNPTSGQDSVLFSEAFSTDIGTITDPDDVTFMFSEQFGEPRPDMLGAFTQQVAPGIENVTLEGAYDQDIWADSSDNRLIGNDGDNVLYGMGGDDRLAGGDGDDILHGGAGNDFYEIASSGHDIIHDQEGVNRIGFADVEIDDLELSIDGADLQFRANDELLATYTDYADNPEVLGGVTAGGETHDVSDLLNGGSQAAQSRSGGMDWLENPAQASEDVDSNVIPWPGARETGHPGLSEDKIAFDRDIDEVDSLLEM